MQLSLEPHPTTLPADPPFKVWANIDHSGALGSIATTNIWFGIGAPAARFVIPAATEPRRADRLWETTCFEAFLRIAGEDGYREWNFAPSGEWAAYDFTGRRSGMAPGEVPSEPYIRMEDNLIWWAVGATIALDADARWKLGLAAVLEEKDGTKSCWALEHPDAQKPDFHHPDCFAAKLP
ncbi:MAG TPA: DOMON-like domain-containing protein [Sphingomicrobium sp.]|nr:DOMON-like domain-containing protein [Sphingomicrobium sp.]